MLGNGQTSDRVPSGGTRQTSSQNPQLGDWDVGTQVCYLLAISRWSNAPASSWGSGGNQGSSPNSSANGWRHSQLRCVVVSKTPSTQVWGGALQAGRVYEGMGNTSDVQGRITTNNTGSYGSWGEYGVLASGSVSGFGSGSGLNHGHSSTNMSNWSSLTYRNQGGFGGYRFASPVSPFAQIEAILQPNSSAPVANTGSARNLTWLRGSVGQRHVIVDSGETLTIGGGTPADNTMGNNQYVVIYGRPGSTVRINTDLRYTDGTISSPAAVLQTIIIADYIDIAEGVEQVDA